MRSAFLIRLLSVGAAALLAANAYVRRPDAPPGAPTVQAKESNSRRPLSAGMNASAEKNDSTELNDSTEGMAPGSAATSSPSPAFEWASVESSDYKQYVVNLRAIGFPEELIRSIVIADIDKLYAPREEPLKPKPVPPDAPPAQRQSYPVAELMERILQLREVRLEKQAVLQEILGAYVPREMLRAPMSRNYEAYEYAIGLLPLEKRDAVQFIQENEFVADDMQKIKFPEHAAELEAYRRSYEERNRALLEILTPEEFERYEMNTTPAGTEMARRVIGMEPTEAESLAMFRVTYEYWLATGGVYGRWRANHVPPEQIAAAEQQLEAGLRDALGPERCLDYQMATSEIGQQLRNLGARYELPRDTLVQAYELQSETDRIAKSIAQVTRAGSPDLPASADLAQLQIRRSDLEQKMAQVLGPGVWEAWQNGRNHQVELKP